MSNEDRIESLERHLRRAQRTAWAALLFAGLTTLGFTLRDPSTITMRGKRGEKLTLSGEGIRYTAGDQKVELAVGVGINLTFSDRSGGSLLLGLIGERHPAILLNGNQLKLSAGGWGEITLDGSKEFPHETMKLAPQRTDAPPKPTP
jgi:hypothetical protein